MSPGVERYLADWLNSVFLQDTHDFEICIGLDNISKDIVPNSVIDKFSVRFIEADNVDTPLSLRNRAMEMMTVQYEFIIFADCDDILESTRITSALIGLKNADIHGCALGLVNDKGEDLKVYFGLTEDEDPNKVLPHYNFLGLSNSAWRARALKACLPAPPDCIAMDWFLATSAWCQGLRIFFDRKVEMRYRQYGVNTACVVPPFTPDQIIKATSIVCDHYRLLIEKLLIPPDKRAILEDAASRVNQFKAKIISCRNRLETYVMALNQMPAHRLWWLTVAHPNLEDLWNY